MDFWYTTLKSIFRVYNALFIRAIHLEGGEKIPEGPKILVANHANASDICVIPFILKEKPYCFIQAEAFTVPILGKLFELNEQIPVVIGQGRAAINTALEKLALGQTIMIFPEGRLNHGRDLRRAGAGATLLAAESGAPLVPIGFYVPPEYTRTMTGRFFGRRNIASWQFGGHCFVHIGEPWRVNLAEEADKSYRVLREYTQNVMAQIADLVDQAKEEAQKWRA
jgi:1-acyl-sn-glycerol-3-phosphate acyltransferase